MTKITGRNALIYVNGSEVSNRNSITISYTRELQEARVFSSATTGAWVEQTAGFQSWTVETNGYYDSNSDLPVTSSVGNTDSPFLMVAYEHRGHTTQYWYGSAWFDITETIGVDGTIEQSLSGTGSGPLYRTWTGW